MTEDSEGTPIERLTLWLNDHGSWESSSDGARWEPTSS